jgi:hypothetical protein
LSPGEVQDDRPPRQDRRTQNHAAEEVGEGVRAGEDREADDDEHALGDQKPERHLRKATVSGSQTYRDHSEQCGGDGDVAGRERMRINRGFEGLLDPHAHPDRPGDQDQRDR